MHKHANADGLSRLPLDGCDLKTENVSTPLDVFTIAQLECSPVTDEIIRRETRSDPALSQVYSTIHSGWNAEQKLRFTQFYQRHDELTLDGGCIIWGLRFVLPPKLPKSSLGGAPRWSSYSQEFHMVARYRSAD